MAALDAARAASPGTIPDGQAKEDGIAVGEAAAADMIALRANDGLSPPAFFEPLAPATAVWQATPSCPIHPATGLRRGAFYHWPHVVPFAIPSASAFRPEPPPAIYSYRYYMAYREVMAVGGVTSTKRPADRADVARFYAGFIPPFYLSKLARQVALARGDSLAENARNFALIAMASNDALIGSFEAKDPTLGSGGPRPRSARAQTTATRGRRATPRSCRSSRRRASPAIPRITRAAPAPRSRCWP